MMRAVADVEIELAKLMGAPPVVEAKAIAGWIARLQSLCHELRQARKKELRTAVKRLKKEEKDAN